MVNTCSFLIQKAGTIRPENTRQPLRPSTPSSKYGGFTLSMEKPSRRSKRHPSAPRWACSDDVCAPLSADQLKHHHLSWNLLRAKKPAIDHLDRDRQMVPVGKLARA